MPALHLSASTRDLTRAAELLGQGDLVAFPTETVYGLGADATQDQAVARIYAAKGRPEFNPLIVHVADIEAAKALVVWSAEAEALARAFWPGPLTLVLPLRDGAPVSRLVTAGLDSLAIRLPAAPVAQGLLRAFGGPVAAPSANRSGQISPTRANHVLNDLGDRIEAVVDGGPCTVGLESTILGLTGTPTLLRPGGVTEEALSAVLGTRIALRRETDGITAPGQTRSHYAPRARVRLNAVDFEPGEARLGFGKVDCDLNLSAEADLTEAAANLFEYLHRLDDGQAQTIAVSPIPHVGLGVAINDRLSRAAADR
ncbi:L-threonylcarbamoyladenylate synthase [Mameliella sediminis]|uniref:L-threonylcarbamoyladenylate synthase n=1 Tax=Mameliella sediminis TaxID=2836866 RepID=UPI001C487C76|nr:L-threonylcarbamoyladenylate synthase [Mameliella sediminis]MBY6113423.1 threonylcarbamoyl-AMP synthase [Antarctobacter heliothermus]MBY6143229.1 threonylcarbamoyl-AMP synthase [Mameliella alba]MBV7394721.1 threonylcarbamoyl-AMP synthase [Mameliella sediminis]MBY6163170.1 threonylcarbamoyl-AMP synthase [Mameliella alba]MBY6171434.1 threonylcarbamoyl-AMP synthase [Mameliella alba]